MNVIVSQPVKDLLTQGHYTHLMVYVEKTGSC